MDRTGAGRSPAGKISPGVTQCPQRKTSSPGRTTSSSGSCRSSKSFRETTNSSSGTGWCRSNSTHRGVLLQGTAYSEHRTRKLRHLPRGGSWRNNIRFRCSVWPGRQQCKDGGRVLGSSSLRPHGMKRVTPSAIRIPPPTPAPSRPPKSSASAYSWRPGIEAGAAP